MLLGLLGVSVAGRRAQRRLVCDVCVRTMRLFVRNCTKRMCACVCTCCTTACTVEIAYFQSLIWESSSFFSRVDKPLGVFDCSNMFCVCHKLSLLECVLVEKVQLLCFYSPPLFSPTLRALVSNEGRCKCLCMCVCVCLHAFVFMHGEITFP